MENDGMLPDDKPVHIGRGRYPEPAYTAPVAPLVTRDEQSELTHLREYWKVILARRYSILAIAATVVLYVLISTMRETPIYRATAVVQIDKENAKVLAFDNLDEIQAGEDDELQTQFKILASRRLARRVVEDLHLNKRGEMTPAAPGIYDLAKQRAQRIASDIFHTLLSPKIDSASTPPSNEPDELRPYVDGYLGGLRVSPVTRTRLVNISYESANRQLAAQIVNSHAEHFISQNLEFRYDATQVASEFLNTELQQMRSKLEKADDALQAYSREHQIIFLGSGDGKNEESSTETQKLAELETNY